ncbi:substrate-binding domain-containing protein [Aestuariirhabdus sp. Z084]|uniref:substrate-binding domain-containing protein n=1 Tax=Aestuariirhabdus haliotis TaxID=2918751 RepID=UPI00201B3D7A|nr:substrate-binding domain-containing protein [Aestuariirhabdus haliotis]MCL6414118.1 substrate-binding domain-containing protein [Aestuariirhabdus haliotis]MCL6418050.1 substrate-binding domain-containing protein [Aestuariirhabdus haliotis]
MRGQFLLLEALVLLALCLPINLRAEPLTFAVIPKAIDNPFFDQVRKGCEQAAAELGVVCRFIGSKGLDIRQQNRLIEQQVDNNVDGIAIAVAGSGFLVTHSMQKVLEADLPIVTFDSDFSAQDLLRYPNLRQAYIGTNNYALGQAMGAEILKQRPQGGTLCIISGHSLSPNMQQRIDGLRDSLQGHRYPGPSARLDTAFWQESPRCPMFSRDNIPRSLQLTEFALRSHSNQPDQLDTLAILGSWPQSSAQDYLNRIAPYRNAIAKRELILVAGDTMPQQLDILKQGGAHANVGQSPYEMGRHAIYTLYRIARGEPYKRVIHTPITLCHPDTVSRCTLSQQKSPAR